MSNPRDEAALQTIFDLRIKQLPTVRTRAEKWIAGLSATVAVLGTATVVKGPEKFTDLPHGTADQVLALSVGAGVALAIGLLCAYSAAFGGSLLVGALDKLLIEPPPESGAASKLDNAVDSETKWARRFLRTALLATIVGTCLLAAAVITSWAPVEEKPDQPVCAIVGGETLTFAVKPDLTSGPIEFTKCS